MNKAELIGAVANKAGLQKRDAERAVDAVIDAVQETLRGGDRVAIAGFGTFEVRARAARKGRNPQTGEEITIKASKSPVFKPGKGFKDYIDA